LAVELKTGRSGSHFQRPKLTRTESQRVVLWRPITPNEPFSLLTIKIEVRNPKQSKKRSARPESAVGTQ
jgi:hypothetical protein